MVCYHCQNDRVIMQAVKTNMQAVKTNMQAVESTRQVNLVMGS